MADIKCKVCTEGTLKKLKNFYICEECGTTFQFEQVESLDDESIKGYTNRIDKLAERLKTNRTAIDKAIQMPKDSGPNVTKFIEFYKWYLNDYYRRTFDICERDCGVIERELKDLQHLQEEKLQLDLKLKLK